MENEVRINVKLPADLLADVKVKAEKHNTTVSVLVRDFLLAYVKHNNEPSCDTDNSIYSYHEKAKKKRELKEAIKHTREDFREKREDLKMSSRKLDTDVVASANYDWRLAIKEYKTFCNEFAEK